MGSSRSTAARPRTSPRSSTTSTSWGIVHDHPIGITSDGTIDAWPRTGRRDASGFAPEPGEFAEAIHRSADRLPDHRIVVAGHGLSTTDDAWHDDQIGRSLEHVVEAAGENLGGYFHDAGVDGYEWKKGFDAPRGLLRRDRSRRPAASTFADVARRSSD